MAHYVYILKSQATGRYYVGSSANPDQRLRDHNTKPKGFTARHRPWAMVFLQDLGTKASAQAAERKIKSWKSRKMIEKVLNGEIDLVEHAAVPRHSRG